ncbi:MAG: 2Fe-2S iron-sulfur cluster-binding protein [Gammaproteobacteria bacterium]|nr:2Fe-2S iron-sulfur cluster-binding protein [Gammaproteobacteria bacterium]
MPRITFVQPDGSRETIEAERGYSVMEVAMDHGIDGIVAECGGGCICSTCHVYVDPDWAPRLEPATSDELALLQFALEPADHSRLSCQIDLVDELDGLVVTVPREQA